AGESHFALSLTTPFALEIEAESEAPVLAWDVHVAGGAARVTWRIATTALRASDVARGLPVPTESAPTASAAAQFVPQRAAVDVAAVPEWTPTRVALGDTGVRRRVRVRIAGAATGGG